MNYEKHLLKDRRFWPTFWTQFLGAFNDNVFKNALVILITFKMFSIFSLGTEQMVALCGGVFILPFFLFSAFAGQVADKYPKDKLMRWIKIWEIIVMVFGSVGFIFENIYLLLGALFLMGLQSTFFGPVKYSILPEIINDDELVHGNALIEMGTFVSILIGTILGGVLMGIPDSGKIYISISVIIFAIIGTFFSFKVSPLKATTPDLKISYGLFRPTLNIIRLGKQNKSVWLSILGISWFWFLGASLLSIFPVYVKNIINGDQNVVTLFLALFSIGVAIGSVVCEKLSKERLELGLVPFGSIGMSFFIIDLFFVGSPFLIDENNLLSLQSFLINPISYRIIFDLLFLSIFSGFFIVPLYTLIQQRSLPKVRSRIIAANNIINALFMVAASIFLTLLYAAGVKTTQLFLVLGIINTIVAIYIYTLIPEFLIRFGVMILSRIFYRLNVKGLKNISEEGSAILVCNHISFVDWLIIAAAVKRPIRFVMHYSFFNIPILKWFFKGAKVIPIAGANEDKTILDDAFKQISKDLSNGELVCIFPEGKITSDGELNTYKKGIEKIIETNPVNVIPMVLDGLWGSFFSRKYGKAASKFSIIPKTIWSRITLKIADPMTPDMVSAKLLEEKSLAMINEEKI